MDGTLVDNMGYHTRSWLDLFAELGISLTPEELHQRPGGYASLQLLQQILGDGVSDAERARLAERKEALYRATYGAHLEPVAGLEAFLQAARSACIPMAVATSAGEDNIRFVLGGLSLECYFACVVGGDEVPQGKRGPEIFLEAARRLKVQAERCLVFEDSLAGIEAAAAAAMKTVVVATDPSAERFRRLPSVVALIRDYTELDLDRLPGRAAPVGPR